MTFSELKNVPSIFFLNLRHSDIKVGRQGENGKDISQEAESIGRWERLLSFNHWP